MITKIAVYGGENTSVWWAIYQVKFIATLHVVGALKQLHHSHNQLRKVFHFHFNYNNPIK